MRRFFADRVDKGIAYITDTEAQHAARVLRMKAGDELIATAEGMDYICVISSISDKEVQAEVRDWQVCPAEPARRMALFQAYMKSDKMEFIVQKACELGMEAVYPFHAKRCVKLGNENAHKRLVRIADEAVKQCGRSRRMTVGECLEFKELLDALKKYDTVIFAYENATAPLKDVFASANGSVALIIGPEGGFEETEAEAFAAAGANTVSLGRRILRGETAAVTLMSIAGYELEWQG